MVRSLGLLMEMLAIVYGVAAFFGKKVKYDIKTVSFIMSEILLTTLINEYDLPVYLLSLSYFLAYIYVLSEYKKGIKPTTLSCILTFGIVVILQQSFYIAIFLLFPKQDELLNILLVNLGCLTVLWILMHYQMLHKFYGLILKNRKIYIGLLLFVCICILINLLGAKDCNYLSGKDYLEVLYFTGLVTVVVIEWQRALAETEKRKAEMEINKLYYAAYEELIALVRDRQHDLKNHINTIYSMIYTTHSYEELVDRQKEYCNFVLESGRETQILLRVDNPLLAGFFYQKEQEIRDQGLQIEYRLEYIAFPLAASEYEMIEMLGILVDNAVEALAASDLPDRKILIGYEREEQWDIFSVSNTSRAYTKEEIERFFQRNYSSKGKGRGIGLDKIRRKLRERDGGIKAENVTEQGQQYLRFSVMLPVKR